MSEGLSKVLGEQTTKSLRNTEQILASIIHGITDPVLLLSKDFTILLANKAFLDKTGYKNEEIIGDHCYKLTHHRETPCQPPHDLCPVIEAQKTGKTAAITHTHFDKEGNEIFVEIMAYPVKDEKGEITQLVYIYRDITELKRVEEDLRKALSESKQRYSEISALLEGTRTVLESHDFNTAARSLFDSCKSLTGATAGYVSLLNKDGTEIEALFLDSGDRIDLNLPMPNQVLREVEILSGKTAYNNDFSNSEFAKFIPEGQVSPVNVLFAPLLITGKVVGLLCLANKPGGFTEKDAQIASGFCKLAAIALTNKRTEEALRKAHDELEMRFQEQNIKLSKVINALQTEVTERKRLEKERKTILYNLGKRVKELSVLHRTESILYYIQKTTPELLQEIISIFPAAWQYPEITAARIIFDDMEFTTSNFSQTRWQQSAGFTTVDGKKGIIEIFYLEERPNKAEGPFMAEERSLINSLAETLRSYFNRKYEENELKKYHEHLEKMLEERTSELKIANEQLQREINERKRAEEALCEINKIPH